MNNYLTQRTILTFLTQALIKPWCTPFVYIGSRPTSPVTRLVPVGLAPPEIRPTETCLALMVSVLPSHTAPMLLYSPLWAPRKSGLVTGPASFHPNGRCVIWIIAPSAQHSHSHRQPSRHQISSIINVVFTPIDISRVRPPYWYSIRNNNALERSGHNCRDKSRNDMTKSPSSKFRKKMAEWCIHAFSVV